MGKRNIRVGDTVYIATGNDKGREGKILSSLKDKVIVEGVNVRIKNIKRSQSNPKGKRIHIEAPIHISNVRLSIAGEPAKLSVKITGKRKELWHRSGNGVSQLYRLVKAKKG
ncbi:50S ribosomal protein L24 [Candidatus Chlamydia sanziniae]|uniref:Large ribosomal subunit protein uL24 n=1 Tax=Candidatus Chlamydia sanziniae TaxID=1806891 RepID=A0A1A9HUQ5_9CHLA|nr:50S ribosomal protein L24 [Candidatus Chlamydia sanziniae]ANH78437.1 LSU ribosomal protein L24p [Candidatus Chlamydia sanziniae]